MAHEMQLISKGCSLRIVVDNLEGIVPSAQNDTSDKRNEQAPKIKLQMLKKGKKQEYIDINLSTTNNPFDVSYNS